MNAKVKNLIVRAITGAVFVAVLVSAICFGYATMGLLFAIITGLSVWEFCSVVNTREDVDTNRTIVTLTGVCLFAATWFYCVTGFNKAFILTLFPIIYLIISELYLQQKSPVNNWAYSMMAILYVALPFSLLNVISIKSIANTADIMYDYLTPLAIFVFLWASDTGAYCVGSLIGKHPLFKRISPNKSWEGSVGGAVLAIGLSMIFAHYDTSLYSTLQWAGMALVVVVFGTWGDLVESLMKRQLGIKDSGNILPGHGGMLDRFDSSLIAIPAVALYLAICESYFR